MMLSSVNTKKRGGNWDGKVNETATIFNTP